MMPMYERRYEDVFGFRCTRFNWPLHLHSAIEFVYVASGCLTVTAEEQTHTLGEGELAVIFPNVVHCYDTPASAGDDRDLIVNDIMVLGLQPDLAGEYAGDLLRFHPQTPFLTAKQVPPEIPQGMRRILQQKAGGRKPNLAICRAWLQLMIALLRSELELEPAREPDFDDLVYKVSNYVLKNFRRPFSLEDMATDLGVGKRRLSNVFSNHLRMTFSDYLNRVRVSAAQELLTTSNKSVVEIMFECGFDSQSTFNRAFRKFCGVSPREYRTRQ